jgi:hypothetical protein
MAASSSVDPFLVHLRYGIGVSRGLANDRCLEGKDMPNHEYRN